MSERRQLINLAYRMLGSLADAEDAVQETYARWYAMTPDQQEVIESPGAWLTTVASRICLNVLSSARARREAYVGQWLPEPVPDPAEWASGQPGAAADPADRVTFDESVSMAFLVVLESMTPAERVAFVLHDVFRYSFAEVAEIVGRTPAACRQLASSARRRIRAAQPPVNPAARQARVVRAFKQAWEACDIDALIGVLDPGAIATGDGGGLVKASLRPIEGGEQIARYLADLARQTPGGVRLLERTVNGQPGLVAQQDGVTLAVYAFEIAGDRITRMWAVLNPGKLRSWAGAGRSLCSMVRPADSSDRVDFAFCVAFPPCACGRDQLSAIERAGPIPASCCLHLSRPLVSTLHRSRPFLCRICPILMVGGGDLPQIT
jgi:RNA polymerase sigma-70 factor (ECF subfamily)